MNRGKFVGQPDRKSGLHAADWIPESVRRLEDLSLLAELLATAEEEPAREERGGDAADRGRAEAGLLPIDAAVSELAAGRTLARKGAKAAPVEDDDPGAPRPLAEHERRAFNDMRVALLDGRVRILSDKQREWAVRRAVEIGISYGDPAIRNSSVPKGRPVETPAVLMNLPKRPPGRRP